jgi:hypothetical protein
VDHVRIFQNFSKEEALLFVVKSSSSSNVDVIKARVTGPYMACRVDSKEGIPCPVLVLYDMSIISEIKKRD